MDESGSKPLHRLLSFFRLFTEFHPRVGAQLYALRVFGRTDLKPGWNAVHAAPGAQRPVRYTWIGPDGGRSTWERPDVPESEIHQVDETEIAAFEGSEAHKVMTALAAEVAGCNLPGFDAEWVRSTVAQIDAASLQPLRGPNPLVDARISRELARLKKLIAANASVPQLTQPLRDVIQDHLSFRLSRTHASNILSVLLAHYLRLPSPLDDSSLADRLVANVDHLIELAAALKNDRHRRTLSAFYSSTILALLLGDTALLICNQLSSRPEASVEQRRFGEKRGLYIDEVMAHELVPCLTHPIDLAPWTAAESLHAQLVGIDEPEGVYAGAGVEKAGPVDSGLAWSSLAAYSERAEAVDVVASIADQNDPLSVPERQRLFMFLLTMQLGRGAGG